MNIYPTIIKSKQLSNGSHKIRLAVSHNSKTRYIPTRYIIDNESNINQRGEVVGLPNASVINRALRSMIKNAFEICDSLDNIEVLDCSQVVDIITNHGLTMPNTYDEITEMFLKYKSSSVSDGSMELIAFSLDTFKRYKGGNFVLSSLTPSIVCGYQSYMKEELKYAPTTIKIKMQSFMELVNFAIKRNIVSYKISPFIDIKLPKPKSRDISLTIEELRGIIGFASSNKCDMETKNVFLLTFYMCGMNMIDLTKVNYNAESVRFKREKTKSRIPSEIYTEFKITDKAKEYANLLPMKNGRLLGHYVGKNWKRHFNHIADAVGIGRERLMMYSARKTFAQLMAEIGYNDSIIEYCIGDMQSSKVISYYRYISKEMADEAIADLVAFVDSGMSTKEYRQRKR